MPMRYAVAYVVTLVVFLGLDFSFVLGLAAPIYKQELGPLLLTSFKAAPSVLFYLIYMFGVVLFVIAPALKEGRWQRATMLGVAFGLVAYATYDLTNLGTMKGFSEKITLIDLTWGMVVTGVSSTVGYLAAKRFG
jgi:uncharacterized membrane protein